MKFKKDSHIRFGKELKLLRDSLLHLYITFGNTHTKKTHNPYKKAYELIDKLRSELDDIEYLEYQRNEGYYLPNPYNEWEEYIE